MSNDSQIKVDSTLKKYFLNNKIVLLFLGPAKLCLAVMACGMFHKDESQAKDKDIAYFQDIS